MYYLLDGYNLIFSLIHSKENLQTLRQKIIRSLQKDFQRKKISGMIVFDGAHRRGEESGLSYSSPLIIAYTSKGESADSYIVEQIEIFPNPKQITLVTNDRGLIRHAKALGAKVQSNDEFITWIKKAKKRHKEVEPKETKENFARLLKIFEERLNQEDAE